MSACSPSGEPLRIWQRVLCFYGGNLVELALLLLALLFCYKEIAEAGALCFDQPVSHR
jgi:hypothetical protein